MKSSTHVNVALPSFWELLAEKLAAHPEWLAVARKNCARWLREGHSGATRLRQWDALLAGAQSSAEGFARLRDFHPLAGSSRAKNGAMRGSYAATGIKASATH